MAKTILIVDDEEDYIKSLTVRLNHKGYNVAAAATADDALKYLRESIPDLVIIDVRLPGISGFELLKEMKKDNRLKTLPAVFLTAGAFDLSEHLNELSAANDFLLKTVDHESIIERISKLV